MYTIERMYVNTNSMTPARAASYYGRPRIITNIFDHWWGLPQNRASSPKNIYDYMKRAGKSVDYILGWENATNKVRIIAMTPPSRVALTQQSGNVYGRSIEVDPLITTNDPRAYELYKALAWLHIQIEKETGKHLPPKLHKEVWATQCSNIDKARVLRERGKWLAGEYDVKKKPAIQGASIIYRGITPKVYVAKRNMKLWEFNHTKHKDMKAVTKQDGSVLIIPKGEPVTIVGYATNKSVDSKYGMTEYSFGEENLGKSSVAKVRKTTGFNVADLELPPKVKAEEPQPAEQPTPEPETPEATDMAVENNKLLKLILDIIKRIFNIKE